MWWCRCCLIIYFQFRLIWNLAFVLFSLLFIFLWNRKPWLDNFMFIIMLMCSKLWIWMGIYFRYILLIISRGTLYLYPTCIWEKNIYFIMIFPPILNSYSPMKASIFVIFLNKKSKGLTTHIYFHNLLWSYLPRVPTILTTCVPGSWWQTLDWGGLRERRQCEDWGSQQREPLVGFGAGGRSWAGS